VNNAVNSTKAGEGTLDNLLHLLPIGRICSTDHDLGSGVFHVQQAAYLPAGRVGIVVCRQPAFPFGVIWKRGSPGEYDAGFEASGQVFG
jgi:hypothetical protein